MATMASVRPLEERDIPEVVGLFERVYPEGRWASRAECESYFREIFLGNPWVDPALASWMAHEGDGARMIGFIGVVPRPMSYKGRSIRAAVITQLMADREKRHGVAAAQLLRKVLAGPQE